MEIERSEWRHRTCERHRDGNRDPISIALATSRSSRHGPPGPPLDLHLLPVEITRAAEDTAERLQCPVDFSVFPTIAALAALAGREAGIRPRSKDDWVERLAFWIVCVAPPSQMKTPALKDAMRPVYRQHSENLKQFAERMTRWRAECDEIKKLPKDKRPGSTGAAHESNHHIGCNG